MHSNQIIWNISAHAIQFNILTLADGSPSIPQREAMKKRSKTKRNNACFMAVDVTAFQVKMVLSFVS